jgi:hypothetical protein
MKLSGGSAAGGVREAGDDRQSTVGPTAVSPLQNSAKPLTGRGRFDRMNSSESINGGGPGSGRYPKGSGEKDRSGANKFDTGFSEHNLNVHFGKHQKEYAEMPKADYSDAAFQLIQSRCGGNIRGYVRENGQIVRYNRLTGDLVIGNDRADNDLDIGIATMHKIPEVKFDRLLKEEAFGDDYY